MILLTFVFVSILLATIHSTCPANGNVPLPKAPREFKEHLDAFHDYLVSNKSLYEELMDTVRDACPNELYRTAFKIIRSNLTSLIIERKPSNPNEIPHLSFVNFYKRNTLTYKYKSVQFDFTLRGEATKKLYVTMTGNVLCLVCYVMDPKEKKVRKCNQE